MKIIDFPSETMSFSYLFILLSLTSCGVLRSVVFLKPNTDDYRHDPKVDISASSEPFRFHTLESGNYGTRLFVNGSLGPGTITLDEFIQRFGTQAFLIIRNDTILYEKYPDPVKSYNPVSSFSISKALITTLVGIAIQEQTLPGLGIPIKQIMPHYPTSKDLTVRHLMNHTSGIRFSKSLLNLTSDQVQFYYGRNLRGRMERRKLINVPGEKFDYHSANTQLLTMALEESSGEPIHQYLETRLWKPLGMQAPAFWSTDREDPKRMVRAFCCLQAHALDFAKLGRLWLRDGDWQGNQLLPPGWINHLLNDNRPDAGRFRSGFMLAGNTCQDAYYAAGLMGQFIYIVPEKNLLILRFGQHRKDYSSFLWREVFSELTRQL